MPIKELLALTVMILGGIYVAHPFDFQSEVRKVEISILREVSRTDNWGDPSFGAARKYNRTHRFSQLGQTGESRGASKVY